MTFDLYTMYATEKAFTMTPEKADALFETIKTWWNYTLCALALVALAWLFARSAEREEREKVDLVTIKLVDGDLSKVKDPTEKVQLAAVAISGTAIKHIEKPSEEVQLAAVRNDARAISHIKKPSPAVQLAAKNKREYDEEVETRVLAYKRQAELEKERMQTDQHIRMLDEQIKALDERMLRNSLDNLSNSIDENNRLRQESIERRSRN
jgi:hypothetical protein